MPRRQEQPRGRAEWEAWEREHHNPRLPVVARCTGCGRGYLSCEGPDPRCLACGAPILLLAQLPPLSP